MYLLCKRRNVMYVVIVVVVFGGLQVEAKNAGMQFIKFIDTAFS